MPFGIESLPGAYEAKQPRGGLLQGLDEGLDRITKENDLRKQLAIKGQYDTQQEEGRQRNRLAVEAAQSQNQQDLVRLQADLKRQRFEGMGKLLNEAPIDATPLPEMEKPSTFRLGLPGETKRLQNWVGEFAAKSREKPQTRMDLMNTAGSEDEYRRKHPKDWSALVSSEEGQAILDRLPKTSTLPRSVQAWELVANDPDEDPAKRHRARMLVDDFKANVTEADILDAKSKIVGGVKADPQAKEAAIRLKAHRDSLKVSVGQAEKAIADERAKFGSLAQKVSQAKSFIQIHDAVDKDGEPKHGPQFDPKPFHSILDEDDAGEYAGYTYSPRGLLDWVETDAEEKKKAELDNEFTKYKDEKRKWDEQYQAALDVIHTAPDETEQIQTRIREKESSRDRVSKLYDEARLMRPDEAPEVEPGQAEDPLGIR